MKTFYRINLNRDIIQNNDKGDLIANKGVLELEKR